MWHAWAFVSAGFATALVLTLTPSFASAQVQDEWWAEDKAKHFAASAVLAAGGYALAATRYESREARLATGFAVSFSAGVAKEIWDARGNGVASWRDMVWNGIGIATGLLVASWIDGPTPVGEAPEPESLPAPVLVWQPDSERAAPPVHRRAHVRVRQFGVRQGIGELTYDDRIRPDLRRAFP